MKTSLIIVLLMAATSAFANITCKGAINYAVSDVLVIQKGLIAGTLTYAEAFDGIDVENGRHRDVILACKVQGPQEKSAYCSIVPKLLIQRDVLIRKNADFSRREKSKLISMNKYNRELARITCP